MKKKSIIFLFALARSSERLRCREYPNLKCTGEPFKKLKNVLSLNSCFDECAKIPGCKYFGSVSDITEGFVNMFIKCAATGETCEYQFGDCFLYGSDACSDFEDSAALILVDRAGLKAG